MLKKTLAVIMGVAVLSLFFFEGCKTADEIVNDFVVTSTSGYSKKIVTLDPDDTGLTSLNLFIAIRNHLDVKGTITRWSFKIKHNIVTLVEVNNDNYKEFNLVMEGDTLLPPDDISELYVNTPQPFLDNALPKEKLSFDQYTPTEVVVDIEIQDGEGNTHNITGRGGYTYEQGVLKESKYDIVGNWQLTASIGGNKKAAQKLAIVGTRTSGRFVLYKSGGGVDVSGSYMVTNYKYFTLSATNGTTYWGEFTSTTDMEGTLLIPYDDRGNPINKTGSWSAKKR